MKTIQISSQYYVVREESDGSVTIVDGPFPEAWQAVSYHRLRDM